MIRVAIVLGIKDHKIRVKGFDEGSYFTLEKAMNFARTKELSKARLKTMNSEDNSVNDVATCTKQIQPPSQHAYGTSGKFNNK